MEIYVYQERVGSNPGGKATVSFFGRELNVYLKYVYSSKLPRGVPFTPHHQPIYEALTLVLARNFGLTVPDFFVLDNRDLDVNFRYGPNVPKHAKNLEPRYPFFFTSVLFEEKKDTGILEELIAEEKIYRDLLMIGDIEGVKQNYGLIQHPYSLPQLVYIDLGCSFVDAHNGVIDQRNHIKLLLRNRTGKGHESLKHDLKNARKLLESCYLITNHLEPHNQKLLSLTDVINNIPNERIPLISTGAKFKGKPNTIKDLLSIEEITEIQNLLMMSFYEVLKQYGHHPENNKRIICEKHTT